MDEETKANADRIVKCVNNYDELVKALERLYNYTLHGNDYLDQCLNDAEAALKQLS